MTIQFTPLGIPVSTSLATQTEFASVVQNQASAALVAQFALTPVGPTGSHYKVASGSNVIVGNI